MILVVSALLLHAPGGPPAKGRHARVLNSPFSHVVAEVAFVGEPRSGDKVAASMPLVVDQVALVSAWPWRALQAINAGVNYD